MWTRWCLVVCLGLAACAPPPDVATDETGPLQVLFIGSSYLAWHDAPEQCHQLLEAAGYQVHVGTVLKPGHFLDQLAGDPDVIAAIAARPWDLVVLQGGGMNVGYPESHHLVLPRMGRHSVATALDTLTKAIAKRGARTIYVHPWAFEDGLLWIPDRGEDYAAMQGDIDRNVDVLARRFELTVAPVGPAWEIAHTERPTVPLFAEDMNHPSLMGSYLMACVLTRTMTGVLPDTEAGRGLVPPATARYLREVAGRVSGAESVTQH